ncbi:MAG: nucleotidyltransferase domain-containing protein [Thermoproteota archaeon]
MTYDDMRDKGLVKLAQMIAKRYVELVHELLGAHLVSAALFGSLATGRFNEESDIDVLLVVEGFSGRSAGSRIWAIMPALERLRNTEEYGAWKKEVGRAVPDISPIVYTPEEVRRHPPLMLDLVYDAQILYDNGFLAREIEILRRKLEEVGAQRIMLPDGSWYWQLAPRVVQGEVVEI